jgi:hypothetical protein
MLDKDADEEKNDGEQNQRYAQGMAGTVDGMLVAGGILRDPLLAGTSAKHGRIIHRFWKCRKPKNSRSRICLIEIVTILPKNLFCFEAALQIVKGISISARRKNRKCSRVRSARMERAFPM